MKGSPFVARCFAMVRISLWYFGFEFLSACFKPVCLAILSSSSVNPISFIVDCFMLLMEYCVLLLFVVIGVFCVFHALYVLGFVDWLVCFWVYFAY
jgi:hypothetical protein